MPMVDSKQETALGNFTTEQLIERANYMRGLNLISLCAAGSGHSGGTLGLMDVCAALYLQVAKHKPTDPSWEDRDRIVSGVLPTWPDA